MAVEFARQPPYDASQGLELTQGRCDYFRLLPLRTANNIAPVKRRVRARTVTTASIATSYLVEITPGDPETVNIVNNPGTPLDVITVELVRNGVSKWVQNLPTSSSLRVNPNIDIPPDPVLW